MKLYEAVVERPRLLYTCTANGCEALRVIAFTMYPHLLKFYMGVCPICGRGFKNSQRLLIHLSSKKRCSNAMSIFVGEAAKVMRKAEMALFYRYKGHKLYIDTPNSCDRAFYIKVNSSYKACVLYAELVRYWMDGGGCIPWWLRPSGFLPKPLPPTLVGLP